MVTKITPPQAPAAKHKPAGITLLKKQRPVKSDLGNLIFAARGKADRKSWLWCVPSTGGYVGGYRTGEAMALDFLKMLRNEQSGMPSNHLTMVVQSFAVKFANENGPDLCNKPLAQRTASFSSLHGQYVGFFNTLSDWLQAGAKQMGNNLDSKSKADLIAKANSGLAFDEAAFARGEQEAKP